MKRFKKFGTALLSCMMLTASFATVSNMTMITVEAHPGRTDAQGGHHDYKNKSGLGSYHYHCGDHEAHLHPNGVCPYKNGAVSNENTSGQTQTQTQTQSAGNQNQVTEQMNTYQPVFDANYYYRNLLGGLYRENPVKSRNYEAVKSSKKWENVGNSYIIPALLLYRYSYI